MQKRSPLAFFVLVFALTVPFFWLGSATDLHVMPGLSASVLMTFCPMVAALLLIWRQSGWAGSMGLLKRSFDFKRIADKRWYLPILLLMPMVSLVVYGLMRLLDLPLPGSSWQGHSVAQVLVGLPVGSALLMFAAFFVGALGEELGWSGYMLGTLQLKRSALQSALILGAVGVVWHLVPLLVMHRTPAWIAWWCLYAVGFRILIVWLFNNTGGSVFAVALFHATLNLSFMLFPINGSHFDMRLGGLVTAAAAAMVVVLWGPNTLARYTDSSHTRFKWMAVTMATLAMLIAGALHFAMPVFRFSHPTGPHAIGTLTYHWVDTERADIFAVDSKARRELMVQIWYPADAGPSTTHAPYMQEADAVMAAFARIHDKPTFLFNQFKYVTTNAVSSARVAGGQANYPVLIFLEGLTGFRQMNTFQVEELVSHGYIVVATDQPGTAANVVFPDGLTCNAQDYLASRWAASSRASPA